MIKGKNRDNIFLFCAKKYLKTKIPFDSITPTGDDKDFCLSKNNLQIQLKSNFYKTPLGISRFLNCFLKGRTDKG